MNLEHFKCSLQDADAFIVYLFWVLTDSGVVVCPVRRLQHALEVSSNTWSCHAVFDATGDVQAVGGVCQDHRLLLDIAAKWFRSMGIVNESKFKDDHNRL